MSPFETSRDASCECLGAAGATYEKIACPAPRPAAARAADAASPGTDAENLCYEPRVHAEYLVFNLVILVPVTVLSFFPPPFFVRHWRAAWGAVAAAALPYLVWDALVTGRHWWFNPLYITGVHVAGLPIEEVLFFFTMPFACLFSWQAIFHADRDTPRAGLLPIYAPALLLAPLGAWLFLARGLEYTGLALGSFGVAAALDLGLRTRVLARPRFLALLAFVVALTTVFNGYLTARPVVLYEERYQLGIRVLTVPAEDYVYGLSLVYLAAVFFQRSLDASAGKPSWLARAIEARLGGYRRTVVAADASLPSQLTGTHRVAVVGSGIAGMTAAAALAERGFTVALFERNAYLGGKVGSWPVRLPDGTETHVSHGFHAFFRQYYNLKRWLDRTGASAHLVPIDDYAILGRGGAPLSFKGTATTPVLNLLSLASRRFFRLRDALLNPKMATLEAMLRYDAEATFARFDDVSFAAFADAAELPPRLRLAFNTFSRAFFAEEDRMSTAELIKGFHFYYLSNDLGLLYDYLSDDYERTLLGPWRAYLEQRGARIELGAEVSAITREAGGGFGVRGEVFDSVVLAADVKGARAILTAPGSVAGEAPELLATVEELRASQRYSVLRIWLDRDIRPDMPVFVCTDRRVLLDSVTVYHRAEAESAAWVQKHGGGVYELHCYAVPDRITSQGEIRRHLLEEWEGFFPEMKGASIIHEEMYVRDDFAAFHVGMAKGRPGVETPVKGLYLAGDWVKLPVPAMLMEAACVSGLYAANAILQREGLRLEEIESVPPRGLLVGLPERPR